MDDCSAIFGPGCRTLDNISDKADTLYNSLNRPCWDSLIFASFVSVLTKGLAHFAHGDFDPRILTKADAGRGILNGGVTAPEVSGSYISTRRQLAMFRTTSRMC